MKIDSRDPRAESVIAAIGEEFHRGTDRLVAIVGGSYLEALTETLLRAAVRKGPISDRLLGPNGGLGAHGARCQLALVLGLITEDQFDDLSAIARIRNAFAHDFQNDKFSNQRIKDLCVTLKQPRYLEELGRQTMGADLARKIVERQTRTPREIFQISVTTLVGALFRRVHYLRRDERDWFSFDPDSARAPEGTG
jgi:DNA-binding MltR family transcriptional regulator